MTRGVKDRETIARLEIARVQIADRERLPAIARERWCRDRSSTAERERNAAVQGESGEGKLRVARDKGGGMANPPPAEHMVQYANVLRGLPDTMGILRRTRSTRQAE